MPKSNSGLEYRSLTLFEGKFSSPKCLQPLASLQDTFTFLRKINYKEWTYPKKRTNPELFLRKFIKQGIQKWIHFRPNLKHNCAASQMYRHNRVESWYGRQPTYRRFGKHIDYRLHLRILLSAFYEILLCRRTMRQQLSRFPAFYISGLFSSRNALTILHSGLLSPYTFLLQALAES